MPRELSTRLEALGAEIVNAKGDDSCVVDRRLIMGASPLASNNIGKLAATTRLHRAEVRLPPPGRSLYPCASGQRREVGG